MYVHALPALFSGYPSAYNLLNVTILRTCVELLVGIGWGKNRKIKDMLQPCRSFILGRGRSGEEE